MLPVLKLLDVWNDCIDQFVFASALHRRKQNTGKIFRKIQFFPNHFWIFTGLCFVQLVTFVKQDDIWFARIIKPLLHPAIIGSGLMSGIQYQNTEIKTVEIRKIGFHQLVPPFFFRLGNLGITVSGQIDQIKLPVHQKIIDMNRFSGNGADSCKILSVEKLVDHRRFSDIGFAGKNNAFLAVIQKFIRLGNGSHKFNVIKIDQIITSITGIDVRIFCFSSVPA